MQLKGFVNLIFLTVILFYFYCNNIIETNKTKTNKGSVSTKSTQNTIFQNVVSIYRFS